jgi:hypothetical protein
LEVLKFSLGLKSLFENAVDFLEGDLGFWVVVFVRVQKNGILSELLFDADFI